MASAGSTTSCSSTTAHTADWPTGQVNRGATTGAPKKPCPQTVAAAPVEMSHLQHLLNTGVHQWSVEQLLEWATHTSQLPPESRPVVRASFESLGCDGEDLLLLHTNILRKRLETFGCRDASALVTMIELALHPGKELKPAAELEPETNLQLQDLPDDLDLWSVASSTASTASCEDGHSSSRSPRTYCSDVTETTLHSIETATIPLHATHHIEQRQGERSVSTLEIQHAIKHGQVYALRHTADGRPRYGIADRKWLIVLITDESLMTGITVINCTREQDRWTDVSQLDEYVRTSFGAELPKQDRRRVKQGIQAAFNKSAEAMDIEAEEAQKKDADSAATPGTTTTRSQLIRPRIKSTPDAGVAIATQKTSPDLTAQTMPDYTPETETESESPSESDAEADPTPRVTVGTISLPVPSSREYYIGRVNNGKWSKPVLIGSFDVPPQFDKWLANACDKLKLKKREQKNLRVFLTATGTVLDKESWDLVNQPIDIDGKRLSAVHLSVVTEGSAHFDFSEKSMIAEVMRLESNLTQQDSDSHLPSHQVRKGRGFARPSGKAATMLCKDCRETFEWSVNEQAFFAARKLREPRRCKTCRATKRGFAAQRETVKGPYLRRG
eukprot:COSAG02_NODE_2352_length_9081_cov_37.519372_1_plen_614_part_00